MVSQKSATTRRNRPLIRTRKIDDIDGAQKIISLCPSSQVIFHMFKCDTNEFLNHWARLILVAKTTILCRNDFLNVNIIDSYVCMGGVDETNVLIPLYVSFWKTVFFFISDGATMSINIFSYVFFFPKYYYYYYSLSNRCERELDRSFLPFFIRHHGASPPLSEIRLKQDEYWGGHGKNGIGG